MICVLARRDPFVPLTVETHFLSNMWPSYFSGQMEHFLFICVVTHLSMICSTFTISYFNFMSSASELLNFPSSHLVLFFLFEESFSFHLKNKLIKIMKNRGLGRDICRTTLLSSYLLICPLPSNSFVYHSD